MRQPLIEEVLYSEKKPINLNRVINPKPVFPTDLLSSHFNGLHL